jgi:hypothetical protein
MDTLPPEFIAVHESGIGTFRPIGHASKCRRLGDERTSGGQPQMTFVTPKRMFGNSVHRANASPDQYASASTRQSRSWRCAISPAVYRPRLTTANGFSPATLLPTPLSRHLPAAPNGIFQTGPLREIESRESHAQCNCNAFNNELKRR